MRRADNLTIFMSLLSRNVGSLNLLDTEGPVQAFNGIALPFIIVNGELSSKARADPS